MTDRTPCRPATSPIPRRSSPLLTAATPTSTSNDADQLQPLHVTTQSTQPARVDVQRQQLKDVDNDDAGGSSADVDNNAAATVVQTPADGEDHSDEDGEHPSTAAAALLGPTTDC